MKEFTRLTPTGETICGWCPEGQFNAQAKEGDALLEGRFPSTEYYFVDGSPIAKPLPPSANYIWNPLTNAWGEDIVKAKKNKAIAIDALRVQKSFANILYDGHVFQADESSQIEIQKKIVEINSAEALGVAVSPMLWRDYANNNYFWNDLVVYKAWINGFVVAIAARYTANRINAFIHKDAMNNLPILAEVEAYDITTGWE